MLAYNIFISRDLELYVYPIYYKYILVIYYTSSINTIRLPNYYIDLYIK